MKKSGINPRTGQPYKRGGAYSKDKQDPTKQALKIAEAAAKEVEKKANDKESIAKLRSEVAKLEAQLTAEKASKEMAVNAAKQVGGGATTGDVSPPALQRWAT